jgi:ABC-2 type transport system ATP-binding protein
LALRESLWLVAKIYNIPKSRYDQLLARFSDTLDLEELLSKPIRTMSLGQKMRAELAATLIHQPKVVYLDEPTIGLDVLVKERIRAFIKEQHREHNTTIVLTTHDLGDIEELCSRVIMIDGGKVIFDGSIDTIKERFGAYRHLVFDVAGDVGSTKAWELPMGTTVIASEPGKLRLRFHRQHTTAAQVAARVLEQCTAQDFHLEEPDLTSIVKEIYAGGIH